MSDRKTSQVAITVGLTKYALKATLRNRFTLMFGLIFPLGVWLYSDSSAVDRPESESRSCSFRTLPLPRARWFLLSKRCLPPRTGRSVLDRGQMRSPLEGKLKSGRSCAVLEPGCIRPGESQGDRHVNPQTRSGHRWRVASCAGMTDSRSNPEGCRDWRQVQRLPATGLDF